MKVSVQVKQDHIDRGTPRSTVSCPIALAIDEQLRPWPSALVTRRNIAFGQINRQTSTKIQKFISNFDAGRTVEPFTLRFVLPR